MVVTKNLFINLRMTNKLKYSDMRKLAMVVIFIVCCVSNAVAVRIEVKEPAIFEVLYMKHTVHDTLYHKSPDWNSQMALRVGKNSSMFYPVKCFWKDSLMYYNAALFFELDRKNWEEGERKTGIWNPLGGLEWEYIFKNMPDGKWTVKNRFDLEDRVYEEDIEVPQWEIEDSVKTILGYECQKAVTDFRGRHWIAWFAPDIPVSDGPWKLSGLPGLILEAHDIKNHYSFTATGILKENPDVNVGIFIFKDCIKMTRDSYFKARYDTMPRPGKASLGDRIRATHNIENNANEKPKESIYPYYDFEETNYPH